MLLKTGVLQDTYEACAGGLAQCLFILWIVVMALFIDKMIRKAKNEDDDDNDDDPYKFT
mgnify:CR=1 FL=1|tara:strand:- start:800 stop:976 length:177 start_codon:yes stop_codon:yes gene_type:complete